VRFNPGETLKTIRVQIISDAIPEPDEYFFVTLYNPQGASILNGKCVVIITELQMMMVHYESSDLPAMHEHETAELSELVERGVIGVKENLIPPEWIVPNPQSNQEPLQVIRSDDRAIDVVLTDIHGRAIAYLQSYQNDWSMETLNPGLYVYRISCTDQSGMLVFKTGKLVILSMP
jgi:hypothetical protein